MTEQEWKERCAKRFEEKAGVSAEQALEMAENCWKEEQCWEDPAAISAPEDSADEEMSCWCDDGEQ